MYEYNDILIFGERDKKIANELISKIPEKKRCIIALGGISGTHKSEIASRLKTLLGRVGRIAEILPLDKYYKKAPKDRKLHRESTGLIGVNELDKAYIYETIGDFKDSIIYKYADVFIVEGLYSLYFPGIDLKIHLDATIESTKEFREERKKEEQSEYRQGVLEKEYCEVNGFKAKADIVIKYNGSVKE